MFIKLWWISSGLFFHGSLRHILPYVVFDFLGNRFWIWKVRGYCVGQKGGSEDHNVDVSLRENSLPLLLRAEGSPRSNG